ncbi:MAG: hypothetical protein WC788_07625 [Candidatus Paceibacterota bacterium]|jgi:hypothetical protein
MPFKAHMKIDELVGETVRRQGFCVAEDEYGIATGCGIAPCEGILKKINYMGKSGQIDSIVMEVGSKPMDLSFNPDPHGKASEKEIYLYHKGKLVYESWSEDSVRAREPDVKKTLAEP